MRLSRTRSLSGTVDPRHLVRRDIARQLDALADRIPDDGLVLVACSGGPDSLALAAGMAEVMRTRPLRAGAVIVDHGLQRGSAQVAQRAAQICAARGLIPVDIITVTPGREGGPENAARQARHAALLDAAEQHAAHAIAFGHTRDDQAETVLLRLARGSGARSLAGIPPISTRTTLTGREVLWLRPLLALARSDVRRAAEVDGLDPWMDPHNLDSAYARTRVRHGVIPTLVEALGAGVVEGLARTADLLRADAEALDLWAGRVFDEAVTATGGAAVIEGESGAVCLDPTVLAGVPTAVRTRVLRHAAVRAGAAAGALTAEHVRAIDALVSDWHGQGEVALPGAVAWRRHGTLGLSPTRDAAAAPD